MQRLEADCVLQKHGSNVARAPNLHGFSWPNSVRDMKTSRLSRLSVAALAFTALVAIALASCALSSCQAYRPITTAETTSKYIRMPSAGKPTLVFVHGVIGDAKATWTNNEVPVPPGSKAPYWPDIVANDSLFDGCGIYVFDYDSPMLSRALTISEVAQHLDSALDKDRPGLCLP